MRNISFIDSEVKMPLLQLPVRSTLVKLQNAVVLISPGSKLTTSELQKLKGVTDIVAPNLLHCAGIQKAGAEFPKAVKWGPEGVRESKPLLVWDQILGRQSWPYNEELPIFEIQGLPSI